MQRRDLGVRVMGFLKKTGCWLANVKSCYEEPAGTKLLLTKGACNTATSKYTLSRLIVDMKNNEGMERYMSYNAFYIADRCSHIHTSLPLTLVTLSRTELFSMSR